MLHANSFDDWPIQTMRTDDFDPCIKMLIRDEVIAARRKQSIITENILQMVTQHIDENGPPKSSHFKQHTSRRETVSRRWNNLVCSQKCIPLKFVRYEQGSKSENWYEDSINQFSDVMQHGNFGNRNRGFSLPADLFRFTVENLAPDRSSLEFLEVIYKINQEQKFHLLFSIYVLKE